MDPHMAEDEDLQKLKEWWKKNGTSIVAGISLGLAAIIGVNGWNYYTSNRAENASSLYFQLRQSANAGNTAATSELVRELTNDFASTPYAPSGALVAAGALYNAQELDQARQLLNWTIDNSKDENIVHTARLRLAYLELGEGNTAQVFELTSVTDPGNFASHYAEIRADAHRLDGATEEAINAYDEALSTLSPVSGYAAVLEAKRNSLAPANQAN